MVGSGQKHFLCIIFAPIFAPQASASAHHWSLVCVSKKLFDTSGIFNNVVKKLLAKIFFGFAH